MSRSRTLGVVVEQTREVPPAFRAGVVWGAIPWITGFQESASWEEAVEALGQRMQSYGYDPVKMIVFESVEAAQAEGRRREAAGDLLRSLEHSRTRLPEILAGEETEPDAADREHLAALDALIQALQEVSNGSYDEASSSVHELGRGKGNTDPETEKEAW
ncbi:MAG: hypothetical protein ACFB50_15650 [Rubrobacteraceae bacterium]